MNWLSENWQGILGGGSITTIVNYFVNRKTNKADFVEKIQSIYDKWVEDNQVRNAELKEDRDLLKSELQNIKDDFRELQKQFNSIQLAYAKEVEQSQNWEKLHRELTDKYNELSKDHEALKSFCEKLKIELDKYKKTK